MATVITPNPHQPPSTSILVEVEFAVEVLDVNSSFPFLSFMESVPGPRNLDSAFLLFSQCIKYSRANIDIILFTARTRVNNRCVLCLTSGVRNGDVGEA